MDKNTSHFSLSLPLLWAFAQRQAKMLEVYRNTLVQMSGESTAASSVGIRAALAKIDHLQSINNQLQANFDALQLELSNLQVSRDDVQRQLQDRLHLYEKLESANNKLRSNFDALQVELSRLQLSHREIQRQLQDRLHLHQGVEAANAELQVNLNALQVTFNNLQVNHEDIQRQLNDAIVYIASLEAAIARKDGELVQYQQQLHYLRNSISHRIFVRPVQKLRRMVLPDGSRRAQAYFRMRRFGRPTPGGQSVVVPTAAPSIPTAAEAPTASKPAPLPLPQLWKEIAKPKPTYPPAPALNIKRGSDVVFTIVSKNYLANARALMESIKTVHPNLTLVTVLVDEIDGYFDPKTEPFQTLLASELGIPRWLHFSMKYDIMELNTAVKPYAIQYLMEVFDAQRVIYFDPDILVYQPLDVILELLNNHLCVLTPHITSPLDDDLIPSEVDFLKVGTYNLGFFAISQQGDWRGLVRWWQDRLYENCTREVERGLFVDQHWMDLVPSLFASVYVLRDPGYNVAYWNLSHRELSFSDKDGYLVNGSPLVFFHFSGFSVKQPEMVSKHQNRFRFDNLNEATRACYLDYRQRLLECGFEQTNKFPYAYSQFDNGIPIPDILRICLRNHDSRGDLWPNPYRHDVPDCFLAWATTPGVMSPFRYLSPYALTLYNKRDDLRSVFPNIYAEHEAAFAAWFIQQNTPSDVFAPAYIEPVRYALDAGGITTPAQTAVALHTSSRRERLARAARYYREFPTKVKPHLPPEAFTETSTKFDGPTNTYGKFRNSLKRMGMLRVAKRVIGMRLLMTAREYFTHAPAAPPQQERISFAPQIDTIAPPYIPDMVSGVSVVGYLRAETGVGQIARDLIKSLNEVDFPVTGHVLSVGNTYRQHDESISSTDDQPNYFLQLFNVNADQAMVVYGALGQDFYKNHYNIGYWFWELADFPDVWDSAFDIYDEIWVATRFVQEAVQAVSPRPVFCIAPPIMVTLPENSSRAQFGLNDDEFVVLFVFDALSIIERKNPWGVIHAFEQAYTEEERAGKVRLVIKVTNLEKIPEKDHLRAEIARVNGVLIDGYLDRLDVYALINHCDVYISLHRSEGYGLTMAEAMYLGKPVIGTGYSGNVDFMNDSNSYIVPFEVVKLGKDYPPYPSDSVWAEPDVSAAARYLREIYDDPVAAQAKGAKAARYIREHYNLKVRGEKIAERLNRILAKNFKVR